MLPQTTFCRTAKPALMDTIMDIITWHKNRDLSNHIEAMKKKQNASTTKRRKFSRTRRYLVNASTSGQA